VAKEKRNIVQIEKDMIYDFYSNTGNQIKDLDAEIRNFETSMEKSETEHRTEIKVYSQKVKHLEYISKSVPDAEDAQKEELQFHLETEKDARKNKGDLKKEYEELD